jgi:methylenetetrahydrofolate reductase (NADH)
LKPESRLAELLENGEFVITAECLPPAGTGISLIEEAAKALVDKVSAVFVPDNPNGTVLCSLAASAELARIGLEPICHISTRDRNRIALQSDLLGASCLGIRNVLCLSGQHQTLGTSPESSNVYDIDSTQLLACVRQMREEGILLNGTKIEGEFSMLAGATANPLLRPLELNMFQLSKKISAGAAFIQTRPVFDLEAFGEWMKAVQAAGLPDKAAILAGVLPLGSAAEAEELRQTRTDCVIPDAIIERITSAGDEEAQRKEGLAICANTMQSLRSMDGIRGIHIFSGGKEDMVPTLLTQSSVR